MTLSKALLTISLLFSTGTGLMAGDEEDLKASFKAALESLNTSDVTYRVMGNVGLVWGLTELAFTVEGQPRQRQDVRLSATLSKSPAGWKIVSWHDSAFPKRLRGGPTQ